MFCGVWPTIKLDKKCGKPPETGGRRSKITPDIVDSSGNLRTLDLIETDKKIEKEMPFVLCFKGSVSGKSDSTNDS